MAALPDRVGLPRRSRSRYPLHDYSLADGYFITVCVQNMVPLLGRIENAEFKPNIIGLLVQGALLQIPGRYQGVDLDCHCLMPNHLHCLLVLHDTAITGRAVSLIQIVQRFKSYTATRYTKLRSERQLSQLPHKLWQDSFHDEVIRDDDHLHRVRQYIANNALAAELRQP